MVGPAGDGQPPFKRAASSGPPIVAKTKKAGPGGSARDLRAAKGPAKAEKEGHEVAKPPPKFKLPVA